MNLFDSFSLRKKENPEAPKKESLPDPGRWSKIDGHYNLSCAEVCGERVTAEMLIQRHIKAELAANYTVIAIPFKYRNNLKHDILFGNCRITPA